MAVCAKTDLPLAWKVETGRMNESPTVWIRATANARSMRRARTTTPTDHSCETDPRRQARRPQAPTCEHGEWRFAQADYDRKATKWRCPTCECQHASAWIKADPAAHAHPAFQVALEGPLPGPCLGRARVRQAQE